MRNIYTQHEESKYSGFFRFITKVVFKVKNKLLMETPKFFKNSLIF